MKAETEIELQIAEITEAIQGLCLGSIENVIIKAAVDELIANWSDHEE